MPSISLRSTIVFLVLLFFLVSSNTEVQGKRFKHKHRKHKKHRRPIPPTLAPTPAPTTMPIGSLDLGWIIGGTRNQLYQGLAALVSPVDDSIYCTCSVIAPNACVTSALCILSNSFGSTGYVISGSFNATMDIMFGEKNLILFIAPFPHYNVGDVSGNIAIVIVEGTFKNKPFQTTYFDPNYFGIEELQYTGFGVNSASFSSSKPQTIRVAPVTFVDLTGKPRDLFYYKTIGTFICGGASGGILLFSDSVIIGIANEQIPCDTPSTPTLYTKISYYNSWIINLNASFGLPDSTIIGSLDDTITLSPIVPRGVRYVKFYTTSTTTNALLQV